MEQELKQITEVAIKEFISSVKKDYNNTITMKYNYDEEFEGFRISHNIKDYCEDDFSEFLGEKIKIMLYDKNIIDFHICYDELMEAPT